MGNVIVNMIHDRLNRKTSPRLLDYVIQHMQSKQVLYGEHRADHVILSSFNGQKFIRPRVIRRKGLPNQLPISDNDDDDDENDDDKETKQGMIQKDENEQVGQEMYEQMYEPTIHGDEEETHEPTIHGRDEERKEKEEEGKEEEEEGASSRKAKKNKGRILLHLDDYLISERMHKWSYFGVMESISFSACGLHVFYHIAVARQLLNRHILTRTIYSTSGGVLAALYYIMDWRHLVSLEDMLDLLPKDSMRYNRSILGALWASVLPTFDGPVGMDLARLRVLSLTEKLIMMNPNTYRIVSGRLIINVTHVPSMESISCSDFSSNKDLMDCIRGATNIPFLAGTNDSSGQVWRGERWVDGGLTDFHPVKDSATICVTTTPLFDCSRTHRLKSLSSTPMTTMSSITTMSSMSSASSSSSSSSSLSSSSSPSSSSSSPSRTCSEHDDSTEPYPDLEFKGSAENICRMLDPYGSNHVLLPRYYRQLWSWGKHDTRIFLSMKQRRLDDTDHNPIQWFRQ